MPYVTQADFAMLQRLKNADRRFVARRDLDAAMAEIGKAYAAREAYILAYAAGDYARAASQAARFLNAFRKATGAAFKK